MSPPSATAAESPEPRGEPQPLIPGEGAQGSLGPLPIKSLAGADAELVRKSMEAVANWDKNLRDSGLPATWELQQKAAEVQQSIQNITEILEGNGMG
jgi:hypothetical protein